MRHCTDIGWATHCKTVLAGVLLAGCGPQFTYIPRQVTALRSPQSCSQGPFDVELVVLSARRGEQIEVYACSPHVIGGRYVLSRGAWRSEGSYGSETPDNKRCVVGPAERVGDAGGPPPAASAHNPKGPAKQAAKASTTTTIEQRLEEVPWAEPPKWCRGTSENGGVSYSWSSSRRVCACGLEETQITSMEWNADVEAPLGVGEKLQLRLWSVEPNDLQGVTFVTRQLALDPATSQKKWLAAQHPKVRSRPTPRPAPPPIETKTASGPTAPPPPARAESQPPRPSVHAEWVPGYWHFSAEVWSWIPGLWRVPDSDIAGHLTATAPSAPPAPRVEVIPTAAFPGAVWVPGQWYWNGQQWVWGEGAWRLPPGPGLRWQAATWRLGSGGAVLMPGGWIAGQP